MSPLPEGKLVLSLNIIAPKQGGGREEEQERRKKEEKFGKSQEGTCTAGGGFSEVFYMYSC